MAVRRKANNGQRKAKPVSDVGAHGNAPIARACPERSRRVMSVRSRRERRNRAGLSFNNFNPMIVREDEIGAERFDLIVADPMLRCEM